MFHWFKRKTTKTAAVIGAGVSGLSAANQLLAAGFDVDVYEAEAVVGGRLASFATEWALIDHGAQYFTARSPEFSAAINRLMKQGHVAQWPFQPAAFAEGMLRPSPDGERRYVGVPTMQTFAQALAQNLRLHLSSPVTSLDVNTTNKLRVITSGCSPIHEYDGILTALPAEQTLRLLSEDVSLSAYLSDVKTFPAWSVAVGFDRDSLPTALADVAGIFVDLPEVSWVSHNSAKPHRRCQDSLDTWIIHFRPEWSHQHATIPLGQLQILTVGLLSRILQRPLPVPKAYDVKFWSLARTSMAAPAQKPLQYLDKPVFCCGDWTEGGRVEGAWLSGLKAANALLAHMKG